MSGSSENLPHLAWFGRRYFADSMVEHGFTVTHRHVPQQQVLTWEDVVVECGCTPDVVVLGDRSLPPVFGGVERFPCLTCFYAVDTHIHSWYPLYGQGFDLVAVSLYDHLRRFTGMQLGDDDLLWLPAYARNELEPIEAEIEDEVQFTGTVDPEITPGRHAFLQELSSHLPQLVIRSGHFRNFFPKARLVLNIAERGDLNYRVFEALAMKRPLLTPDIENGQRELFDVGRELMVYPMGDAQACAKIAQEMLRDPDRLDAMAEAGYARVNSEHRARHRAVAMAGLLKRDLAGQVWLKRLEQAERINKRWLRLIYLNWAEAVDDKLMAAAYLEAARAGLA